MNQQLIKGFAPLLRPLITIGLRGIESIGHILSAGRFHLKQSRCRRMGMNEFLDERLRFPWNFFLKGGTLLISNGPQSRRASWTLSVEPPQGGVQGTVHMLRPTGRGS